MWDNKVLKQKAKERMKVNYWKMLLVGLIIALVSGGTGASSSARNYVTGDKETTQYDDYDEDAFFSGGDIDPDMMVDSLGFWGLFGGMMLGVVVVAVIIGICLAIFVVASITDWFDGHLARKNNLVTNFGKFMDPLADKLLVCSALICMIELDRLPAWFVIIIIAREFIISGFRLIAAENGVVIAANYWGKFKTASQMVMIILLILNFGGAFEILTQVFVWASLALTVISLITYIVQNKNVISMQE